MKGVIYVPMNVDPQTLEGPVEQMLKVLKPEESAVNMTGRNVHVGRLVETGIHICGKHADVQENEFLFLMHNSGYLKNLLY